MVDSTTDGRKGSALVVETLAKRFGAGKTTTVRTLGPLIAPTSGLDPLAAQGVHELIDYRRNNSVVVAVAVLPLITGTKR
jgi:ABC-type Na+ transport system ATPase subunit NatA